MVIPHKLIGNLAAIDRHCIDTLGIPGILLMEEAGRQVAQHVLALLDTLSHRQVVVVCGGGNNGGDGFVCARKLACWGVETVTVLHTASPTDYQGDALLNYQLLAHYPVQVVHFTEASQAATHLTEAGVVVDALFGSGLSRPIEGLNAQLIELMNTGSQRDERCVVAIDLPSGIDGRTGQILGAAVQADMTVTLAAAKPGLYLPPGKGLAGFVVLADIGIPKPLIEADPSQLRLITRNTVASALPQHSPQSHKYSVGCVMVVAGSNAMPGAAQLAAEAALTSGAGMVVLAAPASVFEQLRLAPEIVHCVLPGNPDALSPEAVHTLLEALTTKKCRALALGPGIGTHPDTAQAFRQLLQALAPTTVATLFDADALNLLAQSAVQLPTNSMITPHMGEAARLLNTTSLALETNLLESAHQLRATYGTTAILKASACVVCDGQHTWINPTGTVALATAGSGDVLTGLVAGLLAQGLCSKDAAIAGCYLHGLAGQLAADALTEPGVKASDITRHLPGAFKAVLFGDDEPI